MIAGGLAPGASLAHGEPLARPNVIVILADDMGWGDLSVHGNTSLKTPHIDSLARDGARFDQFFVQPVCAPTRAEFLTGRWHPRGGVRGVTTGAERLDLDETTIADAFRKAGYATGCFGKWHLGSQYPYHPNGRGFDEFYGFCSGHWGEYFNPPLDHNGRVVQGRGYLADDITGRAVEWLTAQVQSKKSFFCHLAFNTPHSPMQVPDVHWDRLTRAELRLRATEPSLEVEAHTRAALAMCENLDWNVGRVLAALDETGAAENTIVVFFSDNGPNGHRWNGGMRGIKGTVDEGGSRSPLFVRWPSRIKAGAHIKTLAGAVDLYPSLAALTETPLVGDKPLDGVNLAPHLLNGDGEARSAERVLYQHWAGKTSVRDQQFRLDAEGRLYDPAVDPGMQHDLSTKLPEVARRLRRARRAWRSTVLTERPQNDDRPLPVGAGNRPTLLPAQDGWPHGGVERSGKAPNASYFTHWTAPEDKMTWDVEVAVAGRYEALVAYACDADDVGATVELTLGEATWSGRIAEAHDPPVRGQEHDRVPRRGESYVREFKQLSLGEADVPAGRGTLTLRAPAIPGKQAADVGSITLVRRDQ